MKKYKINTRYRKFLADTLTPVSIYLKLRDQFANTILLESSDYHGNDNSYSFICFDPISSFSVSLNKIECHFPDQTTSVIEINERGEVLRSFNEFIKSFQYSNLDLKINPIGLFGYTSFEAVRYFEDISMKSQNEIPELLYHLYKYVIAVDHFKNEIFIFENLIGGQKSGLERIYSIITNKNYSVYEFESKGEETSNFSDSEFLDILNKGKQHCLRGDVIQIVLSRRFQISFKGDEFNVYRALRSINPSPYLFYFDYGGFKIFGSSPEAQIVINDNQASIFPIAGTFKRTGDDEADRDLAVALSKDVKENSEHVMLVDLARNDLSRNTLDVKVDRFKDVQFFSHVIHLVSKVTGKLGGDNSSLEIAIDTFPAGTLTGAPKYRAMELISQYENLPRGYYGGAIGFMGFNGDFNHAIIIRSFFSKANKLFYQAGAGVVAKSIPENELNEVNNKLLALRNAVKMAEQIKL